MAQQQKDIRVGWIGLGEMGLGMATNLQKYLASNSSQLTIWNRSLEKTTSVKELGAYVASSIEEVVSKSNVIFTSLSNDAAVEAVYGQLYELASKIQEPIIFVETSTIHPTTAKKNIDQLAAYSQHTYLQCPVFGRPPAAHAAQLVWVTSGNAEAIQKLSPYFGSMSRTTIDLKTTDVTIGSTFKLIGNFFVVGTLELLAEGFAFAGKSGVDSQAVLNLISAVFPSPSWLGYSQLMVNQSTSKAGGFPVDLGLKDVGHMRSVAEANGAVLPTADLAFKHLQTLQEQGKGDQDWSTILQVLKDSTPSKL